MTVPSEPGGDASRERHLECIPPSYGSDFSDGAEERRKRGAAGRRPGVLDIFEFGLLKYLQME